MKNKKEVFLAGTKTIGNILLIAIGVAGVAGVAAIAPNAFQIVKHILPENDIKRHYRYRADASLHTLLKNGYVEKKSSKGKIFFILTKRGKRKYELLKERPEPKRWDGKWRILIFDIQEKQRKKRDILRKELNSYGFYMLQKSVWVYPYPCDTYITLLKTDLSIGKTVQYLLVEHLESHLDLKYEFGLK